MNLTVGTRFVLDGLTYEVKEVENDLVRASKVNPETGKAQRGKPSHFRLSVLSTTANVIDQPLPVAITQDKDADFETEEDIPLIDHDPMTEEQVAEFIKDLNLSADSDW